MVTWQMTLDCARPERLVPFWCEALGYEPKPPPAPHATWREAYLAMGVDPGELEGGGDCCDRAQDPKAEGPDVWFQQVPEGKTVKNRWHLDINVGGGRDRTLEERQERVDARVEELVRIGGFVLTRNLSEELDHYGVTMADPEGNEFCVF
jgi:hypothetical protein